MTKPKAALLVGLLLVASPALLSQDREAAFEMNERHGRGIDLGSTFEAPTETAWGNPWNPEYFALMADLGFRHMRIPVRWETPERIVLMGTAEYGGLRAVSDIAPPDDALLHDPMPEPSQ